MSLRPARHQSHRRLERPEAALSKIAITAGHGTGTAVGGRQRAFVTVSFPSTVAKG